MTSSVPHPSLYFKPRGAARDIFRDASPELLLSGPAGTGKSRAALEKLYWAADTFPGMRGLICRQVRASLSETGLATWENLVLPPKHPARGNCSREHRLSYVFPNGSQINVGGLDRPDKIMSSEYDLIYVQEAVELKVEGWEALTTRLRNGVMPYQQLIADCNPSAPTHWLKKRCDGGVCKMVQSRHEDNPRLHDGRGWTAPGLVYLSKLDNLTGARKQRLRYGRWVQAEGVVYEDWDARVHLVDPFDVPASWARYWSVDFGYTNPLVVQRWAEDLDKRLYLYREFYQTRTLVEDAARLVLADCGCPFADKRDESGKVRRVVDWSKSREPRPRLVVCDHDAEDRKTFERHTGLGTIAATKKVDGGIQLVAERLKVQGDGKPRLFVVRGCTMSADAELRDAGKPTGTAEEFDSYVWADGKAKDVPVKAYDHGMDAARYMAAQLACGGVSVGVYTMGGRG